MGNIPSKRCIWCSSPEMISKEASASVCGSQGRGGDRRMVALRGGRSWGSWIDGPCFQSIHCPVGFSLNEKVCINYDSGRK